MATPAATHAQFIYTTNAGNTLTITGYTGPGGAVTIPSTINGLTVTSIGEYAFAGLTNLASVTIPGSVATIEESAFLSCPNLTNATILYGVATIGSSAFEVSGLRSITLPNSITSIGYFAFAGAGLAGIVIPASVTRIGEGAFQNCPNLTNAVISPGVAAMEGYAFGHTPLARVTIPSSVSSIGEAPFNACASLKAITVDAQNSFYSSTNGVLFDKNQTTLVQYPGGIGGSYTIPNSVTSIIEGAFESCALTSVTIPGSVISIGNDAFSECFSLIDITIPSSVTSIRSDAFAYCLSLEGAYFQGNAPSADCTIFDGDDNLTVYYQAGTSGWGSTFDCVPAVMLNGPNPHGSMQVTITPPGAITDGAQWEVDGGIPQSSGATVLGLSVGSHTVSFSTVSGWAAPASQNVMVFANQTNTATAAYVIELPFITVQPVSQSVVVGGSVTFSVTAVGPGPFSYDWYRNGSSIATATNSSYTTNTVQLADSGSQFFCIISNSYGLVTSSVAALNVLSSNEDVFIVLHNFTGSDGAYPYPGLILSGNTLYGTASSGGSSGNGTVFAVNTDGTGFMTLDSFTGVDGANPLAGLILSGTSFYGTAYNGGSSSNGTVFDANTNGTGFISLYSFTGGSNGALPYGGLILSGTTLYGTTVGGGNAMYGYGAVFAVSTNGAGFTNLHNFTAFDPGTGINSDGSYLYSGLILSGSTLYGTAYAGGSSGNGTVFAVSTNGTGFTTLHSFTGAPGPFYTNSDGANPNELILSGNTLYGTASYGGSSGNGTVFAINTNGTGFTNLYSFTATSDPGYANGTNSDGAYPEAGLLLAGGILYGTASEGGSSGDGTVFAVNTNGTGFTTLHAFTATDPETGVNSDGANPQDGLILSGNTLYGTAYEGGSSGDGTVFALVLAGSTPVPIPLNIQLNGNSVVLSWNDPASAFSLQAAPMVTGVFTNVSGAASPYTNEITGRQQYFRLMAK